MELCVEMRFFGQCAQALSVYERAFRAKSDMRLSYREAAAQGAPQECGDRIWHAEIRLGGVRLMLSDEAGSGRAPKDPTSGCVMSFANPGELFQAYFALLPGADGVRPLRREPFSECVANLTDRFGARWGLILERRPAAPMTAPLALLRPSQLYVSAAKLKAVESEPLADAAPLPVKLLNGVPMLTDGHTRAAALLRAGVAEAPIVWDEDDMDWDLYRQCLGWCEDEGVTSPADLLGRVVPEEAYQSLWPDRCAEAQKARPKA